MMTHDSIKDQPLLKATEKIYTPFVGMNAHVYTSWINSLHAVLAGEANERDWLIVHSLLYELSIAADALVERLETKEAQS